MVVDIVKSAESAMVHGLLTYPLILTMTAMIILAEFLHAAQPIDFT